MTERDFNKLITDYKLIKKPEWIKEIIINADLKIKQTDGRYVYYSCNPAGYAVVDRDHTLSVHFFGKSGKRKVEDKIDKDISKGGKVEWERN